MTPSSVQLTAVPVVALAMLGGCARSVEPADNVAAAAVTKAPPSPGERAQTLVRRQLAGAQDIGFAQEQVFDSEGATIVCGRVSQAGRPSQRYIAVGEDDLFLEGQMEAGHMDQAVAEFCRTPK